MTLKTKKYIRLGLSLVLDAAVIGMIAYAIRFVLGLKGSDTVNYIILLSAVTLLILLTDQGIYAKLFSVLAVVFLPYVGMAALVFSAFEKVYASIFLKRRFSAKNPCKKALEKMSTDASDYINLARYVDYSTNFPPVYAEDATYFDNVDDYISDILNSVRNAKKYVYMEFYIVKHGLYFSMLLTELFKALERGVRVELTVDYFGTGKIDVTESVRELKKAGARVRVYRPPVAFLGLNFNFRTHRKIVAVDGDKGYVGGINFFDDDKIKDSGLLLTGDAAKQLENMIFRIENRPPDYGYSEIDYGKGFIQPFSVSGNKTVEKIYLGILSTAKKEVMISSPYFCFSEEIECALYYLLSSGVKVKILLPKNVSRAVRLVNSFYAEKLKKRGAEIFLYSDGFLHEKLLIADGKVALCGSLNFDIRSQKYQIESGVIIYENSIIDELLMDFSLSVAKSVRAEADDLKLNALSAICQRMLALFSYFV